MTLNEKEAKKEKKKGGMKRRKKQCDEKRGTTASHSNKHASEGSWTKGRTDRLLFDGHGCLYRFLRPSWGRCRLCWYMRRVRGRNGRDRGLWGRRWLDEPLLAGLGSLFLSIAWTAPTCKGKREMRKTSQGSFRAVHQRQMLMLIPLTIKQCNQESTIYFSCFARTLFFRI